MDHFQQNFSTKNKKFFLKSKNVFEKNDFSISYNFLKNKFYLPLSLKNKNKKSTLTQ